VPTDDRTEPGLPIILHCRDAFDDLIPILTASGLPPQCFVFHCFTAGPREMQLLLDFGASVSFTGVLTYPSAPEVREAAALAPLDRVMVETDAPFLSPQPVRKRRPNEPAYVTHIAAEFARLHDADLDTMHEQLNRNTAAFFGIETEATDISIDQLDALPA
jgi:TatD DNase family protein